MTNHKIDFEDGSVLYPSGEILEVTWDTTKFYKGSITLYKKTPILTSTSEKIIKRYIELNNETYRTTMESSATFPSVGKVMWDNYIFLLASFPCVSACRGTDYEGIVIGVEMVSRTVKKAKKTIFCI